MKRNRLVLVAIVVMGLLLPICPASDQKAKSGDKPTRGTDQASVWMTKKLEFSQRILQGLTKGDFEMVRKHADAMIVVGYLERWDRASIPEYRKQLKAFERAKKELVHQAEKKDIAAATKAYTQLVVSCVECHTVIRDSKGK